MKKIVVNGVRLKDCSNKLHDSKLRLIGVTDFYDGDVFVKRIMRFECGFCGECMEVVK